MRYTMPPETALRLLTAFGILLLIGWIPAALITTIFVNDVENRVAVVVFFMKFSFLPGIILVFLMSEWERKREMRRAHG